MTKHITNKDKHVSRTKTKHYKSKYTYPINVYSKNMRFMYDNVILESLLSELSNSLKETQWLKVSKDKYKPINHIEKLRNKLYNYLLSNGVKCNFHYIPIYRHPYYQRFNYKKESFPNTELYYKSGLSLPIFFGLKKKDLKYIVKLIKLFFKF